MRPSRTVTRTIAGVIGRTQRKENMGIHAVVAMGNHLHLLLSPSSLEQQRRFVNQVGSNIARKVGKIVGWRERFRGRRYRAIAVSHEEAAQRILLSVALLLPSSLAISTDPLVSAEVPTQAQLCFDFWDLALDLSATWEQADEIYWACMGF